MKLGAIFFLIPTTVALTGLSSAQIWLASFQQPLKNFIDNPLRRSTIPQFILDARHPWILANQRKLEGLPDAGAILCSSPDFESKDSTVLESKTSREELDVPLDLFDYLEINNNRGEISRPGWPNALERLGEMKRCPRALKQVKKLEVYIYVQSEFSDYYLRVLELSQPPKQLLTLFGDVLESMTSLETLKWGIRKEDTHLFEDAFKSRNLTLPSIKHLEPGPSSQYLVNMCPNLETLRNGGGFMWYHGYMPDNRDWGLMLIQAAASTPKLKSFAMDGGHSGWTPLLVSGKFISCPDSDMVDLTSLYRSQEFHATDRKSRIAWLFGGRSRLHWDQHGGQRRTKSKALLILRRHDQMLT